MNTLCVTASPNVALHRPAYQSSTNYIDHADKAVDGNANMDYNNRSCTVTLDIDYTRPWWAVDLGTTMSVVAIQITNRKDAYSRFFHTKQNQKHIMYDILQW